MNLSIRDYAARSSIPRRILLYLNRIGIIQDPLSSKDQVGLQLLEKIWGNREVLRSQLSRLSMKTRLSLIRTAAISTKWERYAYSRYYNQETGKKLPLKKVVEEIETTFLFRLSDQHIKRLYRIRNRAQVAKHRKKSALKSLLQSTNK
jgi:hypothetical protein